MSRQKHKNKNDAVQEKNADTAENKQDLNTENDSNEENESQVENDVARETEQQAEVQEDVVNTEESEPLESENVELPSNPVEKEEVKESKTLSEIKLKLELDEDELADEPLLALTQDNEIVEVQLPEELKADDIVTPAVKELTLSERTALLIKKAEDNHLHSIAGVLHALLTRVGEAKVVLREVEKLSSHPSLNEMSQSYQDDLHQLVENFSAL